MAAPGGNTLWTSVRSAGLGKVFAAVAMVSSLVTVIPAAVMVGPSSADASAIGTITTVGGGSLGPTAPLSTSLEPMAVALGSTGTLYIADTTGGWAGGRSRIASLSTSGTLTTLAGTALSGYSGDSGPATSALLNNPQGVAASSSGNVYISDRGNSRVRMVNTAGTITTVAGNGVAGFSGDGGSATQAELNVPEGLAVDSSGDLFVADDRNNRVREVTAAGLISTVAGNGTAGYSGDNGPATQAELNGPQDVAVDSSGNLYISDQGNSCIRKVTSSGTITTIAGKCGFGGFSGDGGAATMAQLNNPAGIALDSSGDLFIADSSNGRVREVNTSGTISTVVSSMAPQAVAVDASGNVYVANLGGGSYDFRLVKLVPPSYTPSAVAGNGAPSVSGDGGAVTQAEMEPLSVGFDGQGNYYFVDDGGDNSNGSYVREVNSSGVVNTIAGSGICQHFNSGSKAINAGLCSVAGIAVDSAGNLYLASVAQIWKVDTSGNITLFAGNGTNGYTGDNGPATQAELQNPQGLAVDSSGNVYISDDSSYSVVRKVNTTGTITTYAGNGRSGYGGDGGQASQATLNGPFGIATDPAGNLYIADGSNNRIRKVAASGTISTLAGTGTTGFSGDGGSATNARISSPSAVASDPAGDVFLVDSGNHRIREVNTTGMIQTVGGNGTQGFAGDGGPATQAELEGGNANSWSDALAVGPVGDLYFSGNFRIRAISGVAAQAGPQLVSPQGGALATLETHSSSEPCVVCQVGGSSVQGQVRVLDPVNTATGDYESSGTDLQVPGAGIPLTFSRTYDAKLAQSQVSGNVSPGSLGYGWSYNVGMALAYNATTQVATINEETGSQVIFSPYVAGSSPAWCSGSTNYCPNAPRVIATLNHNTDGTWTFIRDLTSPTTFTFSTSGSLAKITDQAGDTLTATAGTPGSGQCPSTAASCVVWTSSASGRTLTLAFSSLSQLTAVFDPSGNSATFCFYGQTCAPASGGGSKDLASVTDPGPIVTSFSYDTGNSNASLVHDMLTETLPSGGQVSNSYDSQGRIASQSDPHGTATLAYSGDNSSYNGGTTTLTQYPAGTGTGKPTDVTQYQYSSNVLIAQTRGYGTSAPSTSYFNRDPISLLALSVQQPSGTHTSNTLASYSAGGTPLSSADITLSSDALGNVTQRQYNSNNQVWCQVDPADYANAVRCPSSPPTAPPAPGASDPNLGAVISFYNTVGQLTAQTDALGRTTTYSYTSGVTGVPNGLVYCSVDPVQYQKSVSCPAYGSSHVSGTATSTYDSAGDRTSSTDADGNTTSYVYSVPGHPGLVSSQTDPDGTVTTFNYNAAGQITSSVKSFNGYSATTLFAYDSAGRRFCQVSPAESAKGVTCPSAPPSSPPTPSSDPYLGATITTFDSAGRVVQTTNPLGGITYTAYDQAGGAFCSVASAGAAQGVTCPSSPPSSPPTIGNDPYLGATITTFDSQGRATQVTNPLGGITLTQYDTSGNPVQTTVESNNSTSAPNIVTTTSYDADNRPVSTTVAQGSGLASTTEKFYDPNGNVFCSVSANAFAGTSAFQCPSWQVSWIGAPPSPTALYSTNPNSAQANKVTTSFYNADGNQLQTTNPDVQTTVNAYDPDGHAYCGSDPTNVANWLGAHPSGSWPYLCPSTAPSSPPAQGSNPGYTTTIYDPAGRSLSVSDQLGDTTSYTYAPGGQRLTATDPRGKVTTSCYYYQNGSGQCAAAAPAGGGSADDLYSVTTPSTAADPSGELTTHTYFPGDKPNVVTDPAATTTYAYDANGDTSSIAFTNIGSGYGTPTNESFAYNVDGTRHTVTDATGTTTYAYDNNGDLTSQSLSAATGLSSTAISYGYFTTGVLASVTYPSYGSYTNPQVSYAYDATGAMVSETTWLGDKVTFAHDADTNLTGQNNAVSGSNPNGTSYSTFSYDNADRNTQVSSTLNQTCSGSTETLNQSFSGSSGARNADGQLTQYTASYSGSCSGQTSISRNYSYDQAGHAVYQGSSSQGGSSNNFAYDPAGDPTTVSSHDSASNFDTYTQTFDNAGEVTGQTPVSGSQGSSSTYSYDTLGDQTGITSGGSTQSFGYNALGEPTSYTTPTVTANYNYNADGLEVMDKAPFPAWATPIDIDGTTSIKAVSCAASNFCEAVDASGNALNYNGTTWSTATSIDSTRTLTSVSCPTTSFCAAVDASGNATTYNGTSWSAPSLIDRNHSLNGVSCTSASFCAAVDSNGGALTYNGSSWSSATSIDKGNTLNAVSCGSATFCEAVDNAGKALTYNGSTWSAATNIDSTRALNAISCPTASFCAAVDASGYVVTLNGTSWSTPYNADGTHALDAVTCNTASACTAADNNGSVLTYNGTIWSAAQAVDPTRVINGISCPTTTNCSIVDASGYATQYQPTTKTAQLTWDSQSALPVVLSDGNNDYIYGPTNQPVEQISLTTSAPTYLTYTPSDSTWISTNSAGDQTGLWGYDAYGTLAFGTPTSPFGYSGQYIDATTGLANDRARSYRPQTGSFTSRDPAFATTNTAYTYASGDPVNRSDPTGLVTVCFAIWCSSPAQPPAPPTTHQTNVNINVPGIGTTPLPVDSEFKYALDSAIYGHLPVWEVLVAEMPTIVPNATDPNNTLISGLDDTLQTNATDCPPPCNAANPDDFAAAVLIYDKVWSPQLSEEFYLQRNNPDLAYFDYKTSGLEELSHLFSAAASFGQGAEDLGASGKFRITQIFNLWGLPSQIAGKIASDSGSTTTECSPTFVT